MSLRRREEEGEGKRTSGTLELAGIFIYFKCSVSELQLNMGFFSSVRVLVFDIRVDYIPLHLLFKGNDK